VYDIVSVMKLSLYLQ